MSNCLGNPQPFFSDGPAFGKRAQRRMGHGEEGTGEYGRQVGKAEMLVAPCPVEERHRLPEGVERPTIVALDVIGEAEILVGHRVQDAIAARRGEREGALSGGGRLVMHAHHAAML